MTHWSMTRDPEASETSCDEQLTRHPVETRPTFSYLHRRLDFQVAVDAGLHIQLLCIEVYW